MKYNSNQWWNNNKCRCEGRNVYVSKKDYVRNPSKCICENGKYLAGFMDDLMNTCNEVLKSYDEKIKTIPTNLTEKNIICKTQSFYILLAFFLITTLLLIAVSINCYLVKYQTKHLLPFHDTKNLNKSILIIEI